MAPLMCRSWRDRPLSRNGKVVQQMKVIIVGGVAGGATAAARIRRLDEQAQVVVYERSGYVSYANCGLPYYIGASSPTRRT